MNKKTILHTIDRTRLQEIATNSNSLSELLRNIGVSLNGSNFTTLKTRIEKEQINIEHILNHNITFLATLKTTKPLDEILVENSTYQSQTLKKRLLREKLLENKCYECGSPPIWNNKPLVLQLDHINGVPTDNRLENLRLLCPNCHTQTETFCRVKRKTIQNECIDCGEPIHRQSTRCRACKNDSQIRVNWPSHDELLHMVKRHGYAYVAKLLNVSDSSIRRKLKTTNKAGN